MKCCIACKHFAFDVGEQGYSSLTPGSDAYMECAKGHFIRRDLDHGLLPIEGLLSKGLDCPDFELSALAKSKGWKP